MNFSAWKVDPESVALVFGLEQREYLPAGKHLLLLASGEWLSGCVVLKSESGSRMNFAA